MGFRQKASAWEVKLKFLLYKWKVFNQLDIEAALNRLGHSVSLYEEPDSSRRQEQSQELLDVVREYDIVFSVNYFPRVSWACMQSGRKYIAWTVDSPMISMYHTSVFNPCNYIFVFDRFCYYQFRNMGARNVYYMPLAVDTDRLDRLFDNLGPEALVPFQSEVSFVGGLYHKNSYDNIQDKLPAYLRGYFDAAMWAQLDLFGENIFDRMLTVDILEQLAEIVVFEQEPESFSDLKLVFTSTFLGYKMAQLERITCLNMLARSMKVDLYTDQAHEALTNVHVRGTVNYEQDMPKVFRGSRVNLNFTIRNIRSGLPLRVWDVLGAGGFLLTNFQAELPAYFENGRDLVYYESLADMQRKAEYYLAHEDERRQIAQNGHDKVKLFHSYDIRLKEMLKIVEEDSLILSY